MPWGHVLPLRGGSLNLEKFLGWTYFVLSFLSFASANVEKTVFLGPPAINIPNRHPNLDNLYLIPLSPSHTSVRTRLNSSFPMNESPKGREHWLLLEDLTPNARYEVRVCWLATQPTSFSLFTYTLTEAFDTPELISSLSTHAYSRQAKLSDTDLQFLSSRSAPEWRSSSSSPSSILFLRIFAAADYFSLNKTLMTDVPPVLVDIILDPYLWNVFPKSLLPTAGYIAVVVVVAWMVSDLLGKYLRAVASGVFDKSPAEAQSKKDE